MDNSTTRRIGIPGLDSASWGEHICVFFRTKAELLELIVPYIKAGLEADEFCMWVTGDPITQNEAFLALEKVLPDTYRYLAQKQLEILPHSQWYLSSGVFDAQVVLDNWVSKAKHAETKGFSGIRITGNPFWLQSNEDWAQFGRYEQAVHKAIHDQRVIALCTYPKAICQDPHILDTLSSHGSALVRMDGHWDRVSIESQYDRGEIHLRTVDL